MNGDLEIPFRRRVTSQRISLYVSLPKPWVRALQIKKGDYLSLKIGADGSLRIFPEKREREE